MLRAKSIKPEVAPQTVGDLKQIMVAIHQSREAMEDSTTLSENLYTILVGLLAAKEEHPSRRL